MRNLRLTTQLVILCGGLAIALMALSLYTQGELRDALGEAGRLASLREIFLERQIDHLKWKGKLGSFLGDSSVVELNLEKDPHKCGLGKWLYGEGRQNAEKVLPELAETFKALETPHAQLHASAEEIERRLKAGERSRAALELSDSSEKRLEEVMRLLTEARTTISARTKVVEAASAAASRLGVVLLILGGLASLGAAWLLSRWFTAPVNELRRCAQEVAQGSTDLEVTYRSANEFGELADAFRALVSMFETKSREAQAIAKGDLTIEVSAASSRDQLGTAFQKMVEELQGLVRQIHQGFAQVASGSHEISDASQSLSQGATEQASSLEEISSSMTVIGAQAKTSAENAGQANRLVATAREAAERGDREMKAMVAAMNEISGSSQQIGKIIKAIDDIAFQTNLLALNAAVEAARAGKHGKGFAVVAEEVRNLAGRSAKAARETAELIEGSTKKVENGLMVARSTSEAFGQIVENVVKTADLVGEIAAASSEQAQGIAQASQGLSQIDQVTQRTTASAEETASASEELASNASQAKQLLRRFKVPGLEEGPDDAAAPRKRAKAPPPMERKLVRHQGNGASRGNGAWGSPPADQVAKPEDVIALDDKDFGRY
ncbi:MAG: CZB domain-containing protein [Deltaproteobacteria bacterium]|nr:CZB domain-containing protein [Deltaproteobacteria bacterium]